MKSSWTLLAATLLYLGLLQTVAIEQQNTTDTDNDYDEYQYEFEDKILREWIEYLIRRYNANIQSSTNSKNIQRIEKKNRMSSSTKPVQRHENIAPIPIYPLLFNPYYHPTIYSSYIPLYYGTTTRLIPISETSYSQVLLNNQLSREPTHAPETMSSLSLNNYSKLKKPVPVNTYIPPNNQDEIQKQEIGVKTFKKLEEIPTDTEIIFNPINSKGFDHTLMGNPVNNNHKKYEENEKPDTIRDGKLLNDNMNNNLNIMTSEPIQTEKSQEVQHQLSSTTLIPTNNINFSEAYITPIPTTKSDILYSSEIFSNSVSQLPLDTNNRLSDEFYKRTQFISQLSSHSLSTSEHPVTMIDTKSKINKTNDPEKTSIVDDKNQLNEPRNAQPHLQTLNNKDTINIFESSTKSKEKSVEITKTTLNSKTMLSTSEYPTTSLFSTSLCENNDCTSISSHHIIPSIKTTFPANSFHRSVEIKSDFSTTINDEYSNQSDFIISSTRPPSTATTTSESTTIPHKTSKLSIIVPFSTPSPEIFTLSSNSIMTFDNNNEIKSTSSLNTALFPELHHLNNNTTMTSILIENKTEQTPIITTNYDNYTINAKQNTNIPTYYDKSIISSSTSTATSILSNVTQNIIENAVETSTNNFPPDKNTSYTSYRSQEHLITVKINMYSNNKTNYNFPPILTETITKLTPSIMTSNNSYSKDIKQNTNISIYYDNPTIPPSTTATSIQSVATQNTIIQNNVETLKTNLLSNTNILTKSYPSQIYSTTEKTNIHLVDKTNHNFPHTTKGTARSSFRSIVVPIKPRNNIQRKPPLIAVPNDSKYRKSSNNRNRYMAKTENPQTYKSSELWYNDMYTQSPYKKELNEKQIDYLLKKMIKLLKPEIEKQMITNENTSKLVTPKLGDKEKIVNIILPENIILPMYFTNAAKNMENKDNLKNNKGLLKTTDKL